VIGWSSRSRTDLRSASCRSPRLATVPPWPISSPKADSSHTCRTWRSCVRAWTRLPATSQRPTPTWVASVPGRTPCCTKRAFGRRGPSSGQLDTGSSLGTARMSQLSMLRTHPRTGAACSVRQASSHAEATQRVHVRSSSGVERVRSAAGSARRLGVGVARTTCGRAPRLTGFTTVAA